MANPWKVLVWYTQEEVKIDPFSVHKTYEGLGDVNQDYRTSSIIEYFKRKPPILNEIDLKTTSNNDSARAKTLFCIKADLIFSRRIAQQTGYNSTMVFPIKEHLKKAPLRSIERGITVQNL